MTRKDLACVHEPFGTAFYFGPERLASRFEREEAIREESGYQDRTYKKIFNELEQEGSHGKRVFVKDILYSLIPPDGQQAQIAPSLQPTKRGTGTNGETRDVTNGTKEVNGANGVKEVNGTNGVNEVNGTNGVKEVNGTNGVNEVNGTNGGKEVNGSNGVKGANGNDGASAPFPYHSYTEAGNPTVVPESLIKNMHFTFLIRNPHSSIPSYWRCTIPPLVKMTRWKGFYPNEAGYSELRRFFDYLRASGQIGPKMAEARPNTAANGAAKAPNGNAETEAAEICVIDADDLLDDPEGIIKAYCASVGLDYDPDMLSWDTDEEQERAKKVFEKWKGFHEDAIDSTGLKPRAHRKAPKTEAQWDQEWREKYGEDAAKLIRKTVDENMEDYLYLKQFTVKTS